MCNQVYMYIPIGSDKKKVPNKMLTGMEEPTGIATEEEWTDVKHFTNKNSKLHYG